MAAAADVPLIPSGEAMNLPTAARLDVLAARPWPEVAETSGAAALAAYAENRLSAASAWQQIRFWAQLFARTEDDFLPGWIEAVQGARVAHPNMARQYQPAPGAFGDRLSPALRRWLLGQVAFSEEFFSTVTPVDYLPQVLAALEAIHRTHPDGFREYPSLALAIAIVQDLPPPPDWPHGQVNAAALPRRWLPPADSFAWWIRQDRTGRTYHRLARLRADELKFVVDAAAPIAEREWAQQSVALPLSDLAKAYGMVRYRIERVRAMAVQWPGATYRLADLLRDGGICVDQAYFAAEVGKSRGVPTLLFGGAGLDGRHAWFGFLDGSQQWQLDAGRYAEQRYVTGVAYDPQTWARLNDHELKFLAERFRALPSFQQSRIHAIMAAEMLRLGRADEGARAARTAVNYERRNLDAWELLLQAQQTQGARPVAIEATLREAAREFQRYPDLETGFMNRVIASLRARGETSLAAQEERQLAQKYQASRSDLSIQQAAQILERTFADPNFAAQVQAYRTVLNTYGRGAGIEFYDRIVVVFAEHCDRLGQRPAAREALALARTVLRVEPGRQLDREMAALAERLRR